MFGNIVWRVVGIVAVLVLGWWIATRTTISLDVDFNGAAPKAAPEPAKPVAPAPAALAASAPGQVSPDTQLLVKALQDVKSAVENMDLRQQARDTKQDERLDEFGRRLDSLAAPPPDAVPTPTPTGCPAGCVSGTQKVSAR